MKFLHLLLMLACPVLAIAQNISSPSRLTQHISVLAADSLEGRGTGTLGEIKAANYIARQFIQLGLQPKGDQDTYFQSFTTTYKIDGFTHQQYARNVVGYLDNQAEKTFVIGAHYDHLGTGFQGASLAANSVGHIHNGADDNASGVAGMLELAHRLSQNSVKEQFNYLFIAFSGEELGLLGSKYFTESPTVPLNAISGMINLDMIGRYSPEKGITVGGWGTSPIWGQALPIILNNLKVRYQTDSSGIGPSDHTSFYLKDKPVLFFFTGSHTDYHKPTDDIDKINIEGICTIVSVIERLVIFLDSHSSITFTPTANPHTQGTRSTFRVTLGVMPDYNFGGKGLKLDGVSADRPGAKAGLQTGDIITKMGNQMINDIQDYMQVLGKYQKGDTITIEYLRDKSAMTTTVTF